MLTLLIATRNGHKVGEIRSILGADFLCLALTDFPEAPEVLEDAPTFAGNATKKAIELAKWLSFARAGQPQPSTPAFVLADDSGLEVDALGGKPGVHSARFAALDGGAPGNSSAADNNAKLLRLLQGVPRERRTVRFRCVLALTPVLRPRPQTSSPACSADEYELQTELFEGVCAGWLDFAPQGLGGFGYDPLFVPEGFNQTFSQLGEAMKNGFSHRAQALAKLKRRLLALEHTPGDAK